MSTVEQVAETVLYEGYLLFPYRPSARKNQQRWNFGCVYPRGYLAGAEPWQMQTQCLVRGQADTLLEARLRFLQAVDVGDREEAMEREFVIELALGQPGRAVAVSITPGSQEGREWQELEGVFDVAVARLQPDLYQLTARIVNSRLGGSPNRQAALRHSFLSTHTILRAQGGQFISLLEPPDELEALAAACRNVGTWPVLVDDTETMLSSPIILYDYPQVAPQSPGMLFDATEIDELLTLSVMAMTDDEKAELRQADPRGRALLERTESLSAEQLLELHGVMRELR